MKSFRLCQSMILTLHQADGNHHKQSTVQFLDPPPKLPYYVRRKRDHTLPLYLNRRRDLLNEETLDFDYVELVTMKGVEGDVFACEADLRQFLEAELGMPIATHVDELKGRIVIKGADRSIVEKFLYTKGL
ncbi:hypothetical protein ANCDUO_08981 [Ancylostoma duodenale]|uniref:Large ribosomal subunit protein mL49 n=1 Tax=Ancylostoma duodenale TaxID=51022 RepID=A0A0C2DE90_9BILA|nr:hypothetical protein ANCDUO_08981 [Ancylostoma duodenale]